MIWVFWFFSHGWISELAKYCDHVTVICLREGSRALPNNVRVYSLGKENGKPFLGSVVYAVRFIRLTCDCAKITIQFLCI